MSEKTRIRLWEFCIVVVKVIRFIFGKYSVVGLMLGDVKRILEDMLEEKKGDGNVEEE